jgi:hypothetical protein
MAPSTRHPEKLPLSRGQIILRIFGGVLLTACALMVVLGATILNDRLYGPRFVLYWTWCLLLTCGAIIIAVWDMLLVRRISRRTRRELFHREFMGRDFAGKSREGEDL